MPSIIAVTSQKSQKSKVMNPEETQIQEQQQELESATPESVTQEVEEAVGESENPDNPEENLAIESVTEQPSTQTVEQLTTVPEDSEAQELAQRVADLQHQEQILIEQVAAKEAEYKQLQTQIGETQAAMGSLIQESLSELEQRKKKLQITVEQLERRAERIRAEMRTSFAGVSQDLAVRVQGFKDYLVGSLQELATTAEQLQLVPEVSESAIPKVMSTGEMKTPSRETTGAPKFAEQGFQEQVRQIRKILDRYRTKPDYYGPPWQLRRTFEPVHAQRISNWFFTQGGKGAVRTMGSRLQNILISSAAISVLRNLYGDRLRTLVLVNSPERLGEWRRGLQDCLGISRSDFGPEQGIVLFEASEPLAAKAERLVQDGEMPLIVVDESENQISLSMLQFPLWLAFAPDPETPAMIY